MISIRRRLLLTLGLGAAGIIAVAGLLLDHWIRRELSKRMDEELIARASALANALAADEGIIELEGDYGLKNLGDPWRRDLVYEIKLLDDTIVARSSTNPEDRLPDLLPTTSSPVFAACTLARGVPARAIAMRSRVPQEERNADEPDESKPIREPGLPPGATSEWIIVVAQDRREMLAAVSSFRRGYVVIGSLTLLLGAGVIAWSLNRGLRPLDALGRRVAELDPRSLRSGLGSEPLPSELEPIRRRMDELLLRVHDAFERERRFQSAVAHELRTPIAELRTSIEVELLDPESPAQARSLESMGQVVQRMQALVEALMFLRGVESRSAPPSLRVVSVASVLRGVVEESRALADRRAIRVRTLGEHDLALRAHDEWLRIALRNVVTNAVAHAPTGSEVGIDLCGSAERFEVRVVNLAPELEREDVEHMFEPFWRKDGARAGSDHAGLGLSITRSVVESMGMLVEADLDAGKHLSVRIRGPRAAWSRGAS